MKHKALSIIELLIAITIMGISAGAVALSLNAVGKQGAKNEAEKVARYIQSHLRMADVTKDVLWLDIASDKIEVRTGKTYDSSAEPKEPVCNASKKCSYSSTTTPLLYNLIDAEHKVISKDAAVKTSEDIGGQYHITVNGADGKAYYVLIGG